MLNQTPTPQLLLKWILQRLRNSRAQRVLKALRNFPDKKGNFQGIYGSPRILETQVSSFNINVLEIILDDQQKRWLYVPKARRMRGHTPLWHGVSIELRTEECDFFLIQICAYVSDKCFYQKFKTFIHTLKN